MAVAVPMARLGQPVGSGVIQPEQALTMQPQDELCRPRAMPRIDVLIDAPGVMQQRKQAHDAQIRICASCDVQPVVHHPGPM